MGKTRAKRKPKQPTRAEAVNLLSACQIKRVEIAAECQKLQESFAAERDRRVNELISDLAAKGAMVGERLDVLARIVEGEERLKLLLGEDEKIIVDQVKVEDPYMSQADVVEQRKRWPDAHDIGRVVAKVNMVTLVGGFARFDNKTSAEIAAAMRFLSLSQQAEIANARAMDYAAPAVDTSWSGDSEKAMISGDAARKAINALRTDIGDELVDLLRIVIVRDVSIRAIAGPGASGGQVGTWGRRVRRGLALCAEHWHLAGKAVKDGHVIGWSDNSPQRYTGEVVNPKRPLSHAPPLTVGQE